MIKNGVHVEIEDLRNGTMHAYYAPAIFIAETWFMEEYGHEDYKIVNWHE